jgi:hypothetical protein
MANGMEGGTAELDGPARVFADELKLPDRIVDYDLENAVIYARLLSAHDTGEDWREVSRQVLQRDPDIDEVRARRCWNTHLARALWLAEKAYPRAAEDMFQAQDK